MPFILLFYFVFNNWGYAKKSETVKTDSTATNQINPNMPGVSSEVNEADIKDKFGAYLEAYRHNKDASALDNIDNKDGLISNDFSSAYSAEDLKRLQINTDATATGVNTKREIDRRLAQIYANTNANAKPVKNMRADPTAEELTNGFTFNADKDNRKNNAKTDSYNEQMQIFRDQMALVDSMQRTYTGQENADDEEDVGTGKRRKTLTNNFNKKHFDPARDSSFQPLKVSRRLNLSSDFKTITASKPADEIKAMIDQDIKAIAGSRVRIRLLNDIFVGGQLIAKGTYLYGIVTGFQTQRINISINQILEDNTSFPVQLDIFDSDGYLGLYVPGSAFREFTKAIGTQGTQGLSQVRTSDNSNVTTGLISQVFQSTSTSVSKLIQKEKAFLKYNYIVYLRPRN